MNEELSMLADAAEKFFAAELLPHADKYIKQKYVDRELWEKAGEYGLLAASVPEEYGGMGGDFTHDAVIFSELGFSGDSGFGLHVHNIAIHYILAFGTDHQKQGWLPRLATGELIGGICMTEPGTGSDLQAVRTRAEKKGSEYLVNGSKTFISNGQIGNFFVVVAKTDATAGAKGISLFGVETDGQQGFRRGTNLDKLGLAAQDTSELFFENMSVPAENLMGGVEGQGFTQLMNELSWERLIVALGCLGASELAMKETIEYVNERKAFGQPLMQFQNTRFKLAEAKTRLEVTRAFIEKCVAKKANDSLTAAEASMAKLWASEVQNEIVDECLQLHGGYGYMLEYPIARLYADARVQKIYAGTSEIMKELIARSLT
jgi:alkylation response protein AidB-like acyl-CoA dehydrogenase